MTKNLNNFILIHPNLMLGNMCFDVFGELPEGHRHEDDYNVGCPRAEKYIKEGHHFCYSNDLAHIEGINTGWIEEINHLVREHGFLIIIDETYSVALDNINAMRYGK